MWGEMRGTVLISRMTNFLEFPLSLCTMPKHALTFKHFLGSRPHQQGERREKSVHELLSSSRQSAPTAPASGSSIETTWSEPSSPAVSSARDRPPHLWEDTEPVVHP